MKFLSKIDIQNRRPEFKFLPKISIFTQNFNFRPKFQLLPKNFNSICDFCNQKICLLKKSSKIEKTLKFLSKIDINYGPKLNHLKRYRTISFPKSFMKMYFGLLIWNYSSSEQRKDTACILYRMTKFSIQPKIKGPNHVMTIIRLVTY